MTFFKEQQPNILLGLILTAFLCREAFLVTFFPLFTGQDEARHYNTIQWLTINYNPICNERVNDENQNKRDLGTYHFSEEIRKTSDAANLSVWRSENYHKPPFVSGNMGSNESLIKAHYWSRITGICPPDIATNARHFSLFHWVGSLIERVWEQTDILTRFYLIRLMAVLFGACTVLLCYLAAREAGFSVRVGLLIAFILSLQPKLAVYTTNINYDVLLIPCFALFTWAGLRYLKHGPQLGTIVPLLLALGGATLTKGTGLILLGGVAFLIIWTAFQHKLGWWRTLSRTHWLIVVILLIGLGGTLVTTYSLLGLIPNLNPTSLIEYLGKSLPKIPSSSTNFWGTVSWTSFNHGHWFVWGIWAIEALALIGLFRFFRTKLPLVHLPTKTTALFLVTLFFSLQFGVRLHDWHVFQETGSLALGTPGRYFLPTLLPLLLLIATGLGSFMRKPLFLERALALFALLVLSFHLYNTWLIFIPRFYL